MFAFRIGAVRRARLRCRRVALGYPALGDALVGLRKDALGALIARSRVTIARSRVTTVRRPICAVIVVGLWCAVVGGLSAGRADATVATSRVRRTSRVDFGDSLISDGNLQGSQPAFLNGMSCPRVTSCFAVGESLAGSATRSAIERLKGTTWSSMASPNPSGSSITALLGVSCPTIASCFAVGLQVESSTKTFIERWKKGTRWSIMASPNPSGTSASFLTRVACSSTTHCVAAGYDGTRSFSEHWNGTRWCIKA